MFTTLETTNFDALDAANQGWEVRHKPLCTRQFRGHLSIGNIGGLQIDMERWNTGLQLTGASPNQSVGISLLLPRNESDSYLSGGLGVTPEAIDIFGDHMEIDALVQPGSSLIACSISNEALESRNSDPAATLLAELTANHNVASSTRESTDELRQWLGALLNLLAREEIAENTHDLLIDETLLVIARALGSGAALQSKHFRQRYRLARRAHDYMLERQSSPPSIAEVCGVFQVSERSLHYAFKKVYGVSPKQLLKAHRLFAVHSTLKAATPEDQVMDIARRYGFWERGYFARDYQRMFGELPSDTRKRVRG